MSPLPATPYWRMKTRIGSRILLPNGFGKSETSIRFGVVKFTDYIGREKELEESGNPFALAILVHLKTLETKGDPLARFNWKLRLSRILFTRGWERRVIESLFGFIDWIMRLPQELKDRFEAEIEAEEEDEKVELMSPREKNGLKWANWKARWKARWNCLRNSFSNS